eukprot:4017067-Prymnesium_polylepis.1
MRVAHVAAQQQVCVPCTPLHVHHRARRRAVARLGERQDSPQPAAPRAASLIVGIARVVFAVGRRRRRVVDTAVPAASPIERRRWRERAFNHARAAPQEGPEGVALLDGASPCDTEGRREPRQSRSLARHGVRLCAGGGRGRCASSAVPLFARAGGAHLGLRLPRRRRRRRRRQL